VNKLLNDLKKRLISTITKRWWTFKEDYPNVSEIKRTEMRQIRTTLIFKTKLSPIIIKYLVNDLILVWTLWILKIVSTKEIISLTIYITLLSQNVESNPGMEERRENVGKNVNIITYNCNGLGDKKKLKRLLLKVEPIVAKGGIILLQETHIKDITYLSTIWKHNFASNCVKTNAAGIITLFNKDLAEVEKYSDDTGRSLIIALEQDETKLIVSNSYFPNDHREGIKFAEEIYLKLLEFKHKYPEYQVISGGDFNMCMSDKDSLNRNSTVNEKSLSDVILNNNKVTDLIDSYRIIHKEGGYTWKRGSCYSRLDYIFVSSQLVPKIQTAENDWAFETSDHAAVKIRITLDNGPKKGPGITKVNTNILEDPLIAMQIGNELSEMISQTDQFWNPHAKLEFAKVAIRSVFSAKVSELRKNIRSEITDIEEELNQMEDFKIGIVSRADPAQRETDLNDKIDAALTKLKSKLLIQRIKLSDTAAFKSKAKWFEYGEKSNKYFLGLMKSHQSQKLISKITNNNETYVGQKEVTKGITEFYKNLYSANEQIGIDEDDFYKYCPKLTTDQAKILDNELTKQDLELALSTCKDSSPGPDGIPYSVYKKYWNILGPVILEAWKYSVKNKILAPSHVESVITLLPKEGKNLLEIKNWRPITLSNCDSKIITKALAIKVSKVLNSIIDKSQTAYIPGRSVADNLRSNFYMKKYCRQHKIDSVLISLDAKKAFDSVDHKYIENTLKAYGFGEGFVDIFKILYRNITAKILVNGYQSESIKIMRGVKQGDALSCAIFILCIDPLIRNINKNKTIKEIKLVKSLKKNQIYFKGGAYADDVSVICNGSQKSIQGVFDEYSKLTKRSGLELNADKTEILRLNSNIMQSLSIKYLGKNFKITTVESLKICGLFFSINEEDEYKRNVNEKITKLEYKIKQWTPRHLTIEGKILIVKTFGLSQLIYNMQCYGFKLLDLKKAEQIIFKFIWSSNVNNNGIDRIKRSVMKNEYEMGGMKVTDIECLDRSLKLKQFIRAANSNHIISSIQNLIISNNKENSTLRQEYYEITNKEDICSSAQESINIITDYSRDLIHLKSQEEIEADKIIIEEVSSINIETFLNRKKRIFTLCMLLPITKLGITTLGELIQAYEHEVDANLNKSMKLVLKTIPATLVNIAKCFNEEINEVDNNLKYMIDGNNNRKAIGMLTVKDFQATLKKALNRVEITNFGEKLDIGEFDNNNITIFRKYCKNAKLRNIYFRLIHKDFFTHVRMKKFNMTTTDKCPRCGEVETIQHLLWECLQVKLIWKIYNNLMVKVNKTDEQINDYKQIYEVGKTSGTALIKIKVIQELIQIRRPMNWNMENLKKLVTDLVNIEKYNSKISHSEERTSTKWKFLQGIIF
jgi:exonuclease III